MAHELEWIHGLIEILLYHLPGRTQKAMGKTQPEKLVQQMKAEVSAPAGYKSTVLLPSHLAWYNECSFLTVLVIGIHCLMRNTGNDTLKNKRHWKYPFTQAQRVM
jgi:hypothetical protein